MPENAATLEWIAVATLNELWEGEVTDVQVGDELILLVHLNGGDIRAYQGYCPHQKSALADGKLEGHILTCAAHLWQFNLFTGEGVNPKGCQLCRYQSRVQDSTIFVGMVRAEDGESPWKECSPQNS
jgi:toluene monooxygenase system ferredoxin subunit